MPYDLMTTDKPKIAVDTAMGTSTHTLPETHTHDNLNDMSMFDFGIQETDLHYFYTNADGEEVSMLAPKKKAIIRSDTGMFLGNHSVRYKTIPHIDLYKQHTKKLLESDIGKSAVQVTDQTWDNGAKARRTVHFLDHTMKVRDGDEVCLRSDIFNSLDGAWSFQTFTGAYRSLCLNTLVFGGQKFYHENRKHTAGLNVSSALSKIANTLDVFTNQSEKFQLWSNTKITDEQAVQFLVNSICRKESKTMDTLALSKDSNHVDPKLINARLSDYLMYRFQQEQASLGNTIWALYNAMTHWSTHTDETYESQNDKGEWKEISMGRKGSQKANVQKEREIQVRNALDSQAWSTLESLAV